MSVNLEKLFPLFNTYNISNLYHVGKMNIEEKNTGSHEGTGLSVSICPFEWITIARNYSNTTFKISNNKPKFLDYHGLSEEARNAIIDWGIENDYITKSEGYIREYYDDEWECTIVEQYTTLDKVLASICVDIDELSNDELNTIMEEEEIKKETVYNPTKKLEDELGWKPEICVTVTYLITIYAERVLDYHGVYWDDILDTTRLSAPRGVIFNSKLNEFSIKKFKTESQALKNEISKLNDILEEMYE